ncbi:hypothetical protein [Paraburkholderia sp. 32]|uniref:hypothetical protein n=1 Tax=Paraburkholderia sp. 32 TaxID=2991057 RepID=UPI003D262E93
MDRPSLSSFNCIRVGRIVSKVARILHLELITVELHDRLRIGALLVVTLDKLRLPGHIWTDVHQLVPVVAAGANEKKSFLIDLGLDLTEGKPNIAVSTGPHVGTPSVYGEILA